MGGCSGREVLQQRRDRPSSLAVQGWGQAVSPGRSDRLGMGAFLGGRKFPLEPTPQSDSSDLGSFNELFWSITPSKKSSSVALRLQSQSQSRDR